MTFSLALTDSSLEKCISNFLKEDYIDGDTEASLYKCEKCG